MFSQFLSWQCDTSMMYTWWVELSISYRDLLCLVLLYLYQHISVFEQFCRWERIRICIMLVLSRTRQSRGGCKWGWFWTLSLFQHSTHIACKEHWAQCPSTIFPNIEVFLTSPFLAESRKCRRTKAEMEHIAEDSYYTRYIRCQYWVLQTRNSSPSIWFHRWSVCIRTIPLYHWRGISRDIWLVLPKRYLTA